MDWLAKAQERNMLNTLYAPIITKACDSCQTFANEDSADHTLEFGSCFAIKSSSIGAALFQGSLVCMSAEKTFV